MAAWPDNAQGAAVATIERPIAISNGLAAVSNLLRFVGAVTALPQVKEIRADSHSQGMDLWVVMDHEDLEAGEQIYAFEIEFLSRIGDADVRARIAPLDRFKAENIPGESFYRRR
jgi:hypothetical protein